MENLIDLLEIVDISLNKIESSIERKKGKRRKNVIGGIEEAL